MLLNRVLQGLICGIFSLIIFSGCATKEAIKKLPDSEALRERVMAYCDYRVKGEFVKSYEYEDPLYRKATTLSQYVAKMGGAISTWKSAEISDVQIKEDAATVDLKLRVKVRLMSNNAPMAVKEFERDSQVRQQWVKSGELWYHTFKTSRVRESDTD